MAVTLSPRAARAAYAAVRGLARIPGAGAGIDRSPARGILQVARMHATLGGLGRLDQVVIAAIGGSALAGAFELALSCDLRIAAEATSGTASPRPRWASSRAVAAPSGWPAWWGRRRPSS